MLAWIFPKRCPICDCVLKYHANNICPRCRAKLKYVQEPRCFICSKALRDDSQLYCFDCKRKKHNYDRGLALWEYESVSDSIFAFKNLGRYEYVSFYGEEMEKYLGTRIREWNADALIPVPLHKQKQRKRGYNQAEVLAKEIGQRLSIPVRTDIVKRVRKTKAQKYLTGKARENNVKKAFHIYQNDVKLKTIIIIDDVYTTGNTIDAVAGEFQKLGIHRIYYIALAIGRGN